MECRTDYIVAVIEKMYQDMTITFRTGKEKRDILYGIGVKQGDNMAPMEYKWFPQSNNGNKGGRLTSQSPKSKGAEFDLFGLEMHIGGVGDKNSKTECVHFPAANQQQPANLKNIQVKQGFVSFKKCFKYLGSIISSNLNDEMDINALISQANKAMGALREYFRCPQVNLQSKRLSYLAIPINLVLWGVESWALTERCSTKNFKYSPPEVYGKSCKSI
eukprot:scaffold9100_cov64-Attheya_sp.AAC.3